MFHGKGTLHFPNCGVYSAVWEEGKEVNGDYTFADGLPYEESNWDYCTLGDRRFATERNETLRPAGQTQLTNNRNGDPYIEEGQADVGDGFCHTGGGDNQVYDFVTGDALRYLEPGEKPLISKKYRHGPNGSLRRDTGAALASLFKSADVDGLGQLPVEELSTLFTHKSGLRSMVDNDPLMKSSGSVLRDLKESGKETLALDQWIAVFRL